MAWWGRAVLTLVLALAGALNAETSMATDVGVVYRVIGSPLRSGATTTTPLTLQVSTDSTCSSPIVAKTVSLAQATLVERVKLVRLSKAPPPPQELARIGRDYAIFFNRARPHQGIGQRVPDGMAAPSAHGDVIAYPVLGGLHHEYRKAA